MYSIEEMKELIIRVKKTLKHADIWICPTDEHVLMRLPDREHVEYLIENHDGFNENYLDTPLIVRICRYGWEDGEIIRQAVKLPFEIIETMKPQKKGWYPREERIPVLFLPLLSIRTLKERTFYRVKTCCSVAQHIYYQIDDGYIKIWDGPRTMEQRQEDYQEQINEWY